MTAALLPLRVHRVGEADEPFEADGVEVLPPSHRGRDDCEAAEVAGLDDQRVVLEERDDVRLEIPQAVDREGPDLARRALGRKRPQPKTWISASSTSRCASCW